MSNTIKILAIDTSTDACSVAICLYDSSQSQFQIKEHFEVAPKAHTRLLLPMIDNLLKEAGIALADMDAFAFGQGPGSFTGIRTACSVIQALSFGMNIPVVPVSTLRAIAQGAARMSHVTHVFSNLDARLGAVYWGLFELDGTGIMQPISKEKLGPLDQIILPSGNWQNVSEYPHAEDIARIAVFEYQQGHVLPADEVLPVYIRDEVVKK